MDPSWVLALHVARASGLVFGKDIVFTNGPLGYLFFPVYVDRFLWLSAVVSRVAFHTAFYGSLAAFSLRSERPLVNAIILALSGGVVKSFIPLYLLPVSIVILLYLLIDESKRTRYLYLLSATAAIPMYMKLDGGFLSLLTISLGAAWLASKRRYRTSLLLLGSYTACLVMLGFLVIAFRFDALSSFFYTSSQTVFGYTDAMSIYGPSWETMMGAVSIGGLVLLALGQFMHKKKISLLLVLSLGFLFIAYKEGFVRHDLHVLTFFGAWGLFFLLYQASLTKFRKMRLASLLLAILLLESGLAILPSGGIASLQIMYSPTNALNLTSTIDLLSNSSTASVTFGSSVKDLQNHYPLSPQILAMLANHTVDVFPWDVALAYAYGLEWDPRPVFQSFNVYTPYLDQLNAAHFNSKVSPDFVIFAAESIDGRYPLFDEPGTFRSLLCNYSLRAVQWPFLILEKGQNACGSPVLLSKLQVKFGQAVDVPFSYEGYVFSQVNLNHNSLGRLSSLVYKGPFVYVKLEFADATSQIFRFVWDPAKNGVFLSETPNFELFSGRVSPFVKRITFYTDDEKFFEQEIGLVFFEVPFQSPRETDHQPIDNLDGKIALPNGLGYIDRINGQPASGQSINLDRSMGDTITIEGWAVDPTIKDQADQVYVLVDGKVEGLAYYGYLRPDVASTLDNYRYVFAGWKSRLPISSITSGCHDIGVAVITGDYYYSVSSKSPICMVPGNGSKASTPSTEVRPSQGYPTNAFKSEIRRGLGETSGVRTPAQPATPFNHDGTNRLCREMKDCIASIHRLL